MQSMYSVVLQKFTLASLFASWIHNEYLAYEMIDHVLHKIDWAIYQEIAPWNKEYKYCMLEHDIPPAVHHALPAFIHSYIYCAATAIRKAWIHSSD